MARLVFRVLSFLAFWRKLPNGGLVSGNQKASTQLKKRRVEIVAIGANEKSKITGKPDLRTRCFKPKFNVTADRHELSTFCVDGLEETGRWDLLSLHVRPLLARAELEARVFVDAGLTVDPDWEPERHVNIVDWPASEEEITSVAQESLASAQRFFRKAA